MTLFKPFLKVFNDGASTVSLSNVMLQCKVLANLSPESSLLLFKAIISCLVLQNSLLPFVFTVAFYTAKGFYHGVFEFSPP